MLTERDHDFVTEQLANFRAVLDFFRRRLVSARDALEATEDVFRLAEGENASPDASTPAWLLFQAHALWLAGAAGEARLRFPGSEPGQHGPGSEPGQYSPVSAAELGEVPGPALMARAGAALGRIDPRDRELLMLLYWDRLSEAGLAGLLGCNRWLLRLRLRRARRNLAASLAGVPGLAATSGTDGTAGGDGTAGADLRDFVRSGGGQLASALQDLDPAAAEPSNDTGLNPGAVAWHTLKRISDDGAIFTDSGRPSARPATRSRRRWPVLAAVVGLAAVLALGAGVVNGLWTVSQAPTEPADALASAASSDSTAPAGVLHSRLRGSPDHPRADQATAAPAAGDCSTRNVSSVSVSRLFTTRDLTSHPEYFTVFGCAGGWMAFGVSPEGQPHLAAPGPDTSFFLARLDDGGRYLFDSRQTYSIMAGWQTVGAWAGQLGQGLSSPELMDRQFEIKGGPVALREQLVGDGL